MYFVSKHLLMFIHIFILCICYFCIPFNPLFYVYVTSASPLIPYPQISLNCYIGGAGKGFLMRRGVYGKGIKTGHLQKHVQNTHNLKSTFEENLYENNIHHFLYYEEAEVNEQFNCLKTEQFSILSLKVQSLLGKWFEFKIC